MLSLSGLVAWDKESGAVPKAGAAPVVLGYLMEAIRQLVAALVKTKGITVSCNAIRLRTFVKKK